jgi:hypothetical protein
MDFPGIPKVTQEDQRNKPHTRGVMRYVGSRGSSTANEKLTSHATLREFKKSGYIQKKAEDCILKKWVPAISMRSVRLPRAPIAEPGLPFI